MTLLAYITRLFPVISAQKADGLKRFYSNLLLLDLVNAEVHF